MPLKQYDTMSVDTRSLPRESIGTQRHNKVAQRVHWEMCRNYGIECTDKWYNHQPLPIAENEEVGITWDMTIYILDKVLKHNQPDITLVHKDSQKWALIDIAVLVDQNITRAEEEKVEMYQELAFEIRRIKNSLKGNQLLCLQVNSPTGQFTYTEVNLPTPLKLMRLHPPTH